MEKDLNNKEFYNDMLKEMVKYINVLVSLKMFLLKMDKMLVSSWLV